MMWNKLLSGRLWLTFITGWTFAYCACTGILESQAIVAIIASVFTAYFSRNDRGQQDTTTMSVRSKHINPPAT